MRVLMFVTDDGRSSEGAGPTLIVEDSPRSTLPAHPRGFAWKYFATVGLDDALLAAERALIERALRDGLSFISRRLVSVPAL